jgi:hypothetical protein
MKKIQLILVPTFILVLSLITSVPAHATTSGVVIVSVNQTFTAPEGTVVVTGAIGDFGTIQGSDLLGKPSKASPAPAALIKLKKGTIIIDATNMNSATNTAPLLQQVTCSFSISATSVPWPIIFGTGAYKNIKGSLTTTINLGGITPRVAKGANKGKCDFSNKYPPIASFFNAIASGNITY